MAAATFGVIHKTITTAGTAEALYASSLKVASVTIQAKGGNNAGVGANTGKVFIGDSTVTNAGTSGLQLAIPGSGTTAPAMRIDSGNSDNLIDLQDIYIDVGVSGEGVVALYMQRT